MKRKAISLALMGLVGSALALGSMTASAHEVVGFGVNVGVPAYAPAYPAYPAYPAPYYDPYYAAPYYYGGYYPYPYYGYPYPYRPCIWRRWWNGYGWVRSCV